MLFIVFVAEYIECHPLIKRFRVKTVSSRKVNEISNDRFGKATAPNFFVDSYTWEIPGPLVHSRKGIKKSGFAAVRISYQGNLDCIFIRKADKGLNGFHFLKCYFFLTIETSMVEASSLR